MAHNQLASPKFPEPIVNTLRITGKARSRGRSALRARICSGEGLAANSGKPLFDVILRRPIELACS